MGRDSAEGVRAELSFEHSVPKNQLKLRHRVLRTPGKGSLDLTFEADDFFAHQVHFYGEQSQPHFTSPCEGCMLQKDLRWEGYIWATKNATGELFMFAFPPTAGSTIEGLRERYGALHGMSVRCSRLQGRSNGPVRVEQREHLRDYRRIPRLPPIDLFLAALWRKSVQRQLQGTNDPLGEIPAAQQGMYDSLFDRVNGNVLQTSKDDHEH
jgi:hypothetical protein